MRPGVYSTHSETQLATCHELLQEVFRAVILQCDHRVLEGHRSKARQNQLFHLGHSQVQWPRSFHNKEPSYAIDAYIWLRRKPHIDWTARGIEAQRHFAGLVRGVAWSKGIPIIWGGDWDGDYIFRDQKFHDLPHFQLNSRLL